MTVDVARGVGSVGRTWPQPWASTGSLPPPGTGSPYVWDTQSAMAIPSVARAVQLITSMVKQMPLDAFRGVDPLPRPTILATLDPERARSWFVQVNVEDYLLNGNAISYVTSLGSDGWPLSCTWVPSQWVTIVWFPDQQIPTYYVGGQQLDPTLVIHVRRGADRWMPWRGVGVVEQSLNTLQRVAMEEAYEQGALSSGGVPSVAIIAPNPRLSQEEADQGKTDWLAKFAPVGAVSSREPVILPAGTVVTPLAWSPEDTQMVAARQLSLTDIANAFNLDGSWLGANTGSMTYKSPGPLYLQMLRTTIEPVLQDFEQVWSDKMLPRGQSVRFDRWQILRDDLSVTVATLVAATGAGIMSTEEARQYLGLGLRASGVPDVSTVSPVDTTETPQPIDEATPEDTPAPDAPSEVTP